MRTKLPNTAESVGIGFLLGLIAGVLEGYFLSAVPLGLLAGTILGLLRVALGTVYDVMTGGPR